MERVESWLFGSASSHPALPPAPLPGNLLLPLHPDTGGAVFGEPVPLLLYPPLGSSVSSIVHLLDEQVLLGTDAGKLSLYQIHCGDGRDECTSIATAQLGQCVRELAVAHAGGGHAFALCGGSVVAVELPLLQQLTPLPPVSGSVRCMCVKKADHMTPQPATASLCVATEHAVLVYAFFGGSDGSSSDNDNGASTSGIGLKVDCFFSLVATVGFGARSFLKHGEMGRHLCILSPCTNSI